MDHWKEMGRDMKRVFVTLMIVGVALCEAVGADEDQESIRIEKRGKENVLLITGRIKSRHVSFRKGKSVRSYYIVTPELIKIALPRSHVEHRDGTRSGIYLRAWRGKEVDLVCEGRMKKDDKKKLVVTVRKIVSLVTAKR
jgi:hypothetical protein